MNRIIPFYMVHESYNFRIYTVHESYNYTRHLRLPYLAQVIRFMNRITGRRHKSRIRDAYN